MLESAQTPPLDGLQCARLDKKNAAAETVVLTVPVAAGKYELLQLPYSRYEEEIVKIKEELQ